MEHHESDTSREAAKATTDRADVRSTFPQLAHLREDDYEGQVAAYRSVLDQLRKELDHLDD